MNPLQKIAPFLKRQGAHPSHHSYRMLWIIQFPNVLIGMVKSGKCEEFGSPSTQGRLSMEGTLIRQGWQYNIGQLWQVALTHVEIILNAISICHNHALHTSLGYKHWWSDSRYADRMIELSQFKGETSPRYSVSMCEEPLLEKSSFEVSVKKPPSMAYSAVDRRNVQTYFCGNYLTHGCENPNKFASSCCIRVDLCAALTIHIWDSCKLILSYRLTLSKQYGGTLCTKTNNSFPT